MTLIGKVIRAPAGAQGFDTDTVVSAQQAQQLRGAGFMFCVRYLSRAEGESSADLTPAEAGRILDAGLALMPIQHVARRGWVPTTELGTTYGKAAAANATAVGFPPGLNVWLDLEGVLGAVASEEVIRYCNAWFFEVESAGFVPGLYVGAEAILTGDELYWRLRAKHYWRSASRVPPIPHRGYQMFQALAPSPVTGISIDRDVTKDDGFGEAVLWLAPSQGRSRSVRGRRPGRGNTPR
jgi:glycoside hydrolase-like protein